MEHFVAIDCGGSKTETLLFNRKGEILSRAIGLGANPTDLGAEEARRRVFEVLDGLLSGDDEPPAALYGAMAGEVPNGDVFSAAMRERYGIERIRIEDDGCCIITGNLGRADGCALVCGTGSSLFVRRAGQKLRHIGGKGYLIDTGGSGFELGREALRAAMRAFDGRGEATALTGILAKRLGREIDDGIIPMVHRGGRAFIASLSGAVFEGVDAGDAVCREIFEDQSAQLASLIHAAVVSFDGQFTVVAGGGIMAGRPDYLEAVRRKSPLQAHMELQKAPPVFGAAREALYTAGLEPDSNFDGRFLADYAKIRQG